MYLSSLRSRIAVGWRSMRLSVRLALGFGALMSLMLVVVVLAVLQFAKLGYNSERMMNRDLQRLLQVQELRQYADSHGNAMARLLTAPRRDRESIYPMIDAENALIEHHIGELEQSAREPASVELLAQVAQRQQQYRKVFADVVLWIESDDVTRARRIFNDRAEPELRALLDASAALFQHEQAALRQRQDAIGEAVQRAQWSLAAVALASIALAMFLAWSTTASVVRPLAQVEGAARRIASGDYEARVSVRSRQV